MTQTLPSVVRCLFLFLLGFILMPFSLQAMDKATTIDLPGDTLILLLPSCEDEIDLCLDNLPLTEAINLYITVNGQPYQNTFTGCNFDTISAYTYATLFGQGDSGPYELTNWQVGDNVFTGIFNSIPDLVDSMNLWDPAGNWVLEEASRLIAGGQSGQTYSDMSVLVISISTPSFIGYNFGIEARGLALSFGFGVHNVNILDTLNNTVRKAVISVVCPSSRTITDVVRPNEMKAHCLDFSRLIGALQSVNLLVDSNQHNVDFELSANDSCVFYTGISLGLDTAIVVACDDLGFCDTTILLVNVHATPTVETISMTLTVGDSVEICPETTELLGIVEGIDFFCENNDAETIIFNINNVNLCSQVTANNVGIDSICVVICDNFLICDTTYYIFTVVSNSPSLTATPDFDTTSINSPVIIDVLGNDIIPDGILTEMEIVVPNETATNNTATANLNGTVTFTPQQNFCGDFEVFHYRICNDTGCDTTMVSILVTCEPSNTDLEIFTGFSPNGDGQNDFFTIDGLAQFPNNELAVYNRWGTRVYQMKGYKNAWDGTWGDKQLPDGTYYYVLKDGQGKVFSGFLYIKR